MLTSRWRGALRGQGSSDYSRNDEASISKVGKQNLVTKAPGGSNPGRPGGGWGGQQSSEIGTECPMSKGWKTSLVNSGNRRVELVQALVESSPAVLCR